MAAESDVLCEIEVLQSIYLDELLVTRREDRGWEVSLVLYPSTGEDSVSQFVRLTLTLTLDQQYPSSSPVISIHNPRGLSDDKLSSVQKCLQLEAQSSLGSPVLYQLIEKAKEILTESNIPHGNCVICLYGFKEGETFTKTSCYHYFHSHCLGRYVRHSERELRQREKELEEDKTRERDERQELTVVCPVCREPLSYDVDQLLSSPVPQLPELDEAAISSDFQHKWFELQKLLERQRCRGGIIDPEEESNRFLIHINEAPSASENGNLEADDPPAPPALPQQAPSASNASSSDEAGVRAERPVPGLSHCRGGGGQSQRRRPRRGGRFRPHQERGRAAPITEHLDKLSLTPHCSDGPTKAAKPQGNHGQRAQGDARQQTQVSAGEPSLETESFKDAADSAAGGGGGGGRGSRPPWKEEVGGASPVRPARPCPRHRAASLPLGQPGFEKGGGGGGGGGARRAHAVRGYQQRAMERDRGREEVL
ncbi:E3 ubiquitin-protein ligase RNF25 [Scomber japonicus]|uniref:E3 ubiquitin-protein ligase RNF25 n=1 Tax=Scomber japonicus TaxID=13676 RepID=UPI002306CBDD|nr:E3 ubiquitin-protein ligase RNF25 [Scomber japonicus]